MQHIQHKRLAKRLVPRFDPTWLGQADPTSTNAEPTSTVAVLPPVVATPDPVVTSTPTVPSQLPATSAPAASSSNPVVNTPAASSSAPVVEQSTSSLLTSSTELASSSTPLIATSSSTPAAVQSTPAQQSSTRAVSNTPAQVASSPSVTVRGGTTLIVTATASPTGSASPSATAAPTNSNVGTIVGAVAGSLVGIVCLIAFVSWLIRQHNKRKSGNHDDFDRQSYLRNSMMIPEEPGAGRPVMGTQAALALARNNNPRPPTMIERKPTYLMHNGQPEPSYHPGQVVSFEPGQIVSAPPTADGAAYPSPMAFAAYTPPAQHHQSELSRRPSGAKLLDRQPTNGGMYGPPYAQAPSPIGYGPDPYAAQTPQSYQHDGYTYPMHPGTPDRTMIQSVTPFQAQQYAEITRALEGPDFANDSFHPISPVSPAAGANAYSPPSPPEKALPNPFEEPPAAPSQRIDSTPPSLPAIESLSRTGTPIDPNPQHAHWSYDGKGQVEGHRLSVAGMPAPIVEAPAMPPAAVTREQRPAAGAHAQNQRPVSYVDTDDAYGGM